jgi:mycofactocin precursor
MFIPVEQRPETVHSLSSVHCPSLPVTPIGLTRVVARHPEPLGGALPEVTEELLIEEVSIDGMCGVY